ncbi:uncharacterized protein PFLUO_LOCUS4821 [Penicillium psychrofluorescens]|uniref:uncharacterized protein n=1 Tax=Penicillium psychrofluorescens TaxID=3158075 RepID=UPI003CCCDC36
MDQPKDYSQDVKSGTEVEGHGQTIAVSATERLYSPLLGIPKDRLLQDVAQFSHEHGLTGNTEALLIKGALVAQSPSELETISELDTEDVQALHDEQAHRWRHPKILYFTIIMNSIAAAIRGWDQTVD